MAVRATAIPADVLDILKRGMIISGNAYCLPAEQLARDVYERVDKVLKGIGGKWNRTKRAHVFKFDPAEALGLAFENGKFVDRKKALQFFETPEDVGRRLIERARVTAADRILEPSAGHGALLRVMPPETGWVTAIEIDDGNCRVLSALGMPYRLDIVHGCFLAHAKATEDRFDIVVMNPPFTGNQDVEHIRAAWSLLKAGGRLVAICGEGTFFRQDKTAKEFRDWLFEAGFDDEKLPPGTFRESGTEVATRMIWATKEGP